MKKQESYWSFRAPDTPEFSDLPEGAFAGTETGWNSLSPGYRREIYRSATKRVQNLDSERMERADVKHQQSLEQIRKREAL